jgi:hypothetical protein
VLICAGRISHSIIQGSSVPINDCCYFGDGTPVIYDHVLDEDPLFENFMVGDFRLRPGSPAIDAGDPNSPPDADGSRRDMGVSFPGLPPHYIFLRGDSNGDGVIDIADAVRTLLGLFVRPGLLTCPDAADFDNSGTLEITDAINVLTHIFMRNVSWPRPPYPAFGVDWTGGGDGLDPLGPGDPLGCRW